MQTGSKPGCYNLLDTLWLNLETSAKAKKDAPIFQNFQLPISQPVQNPPVV